jgi:hypothetical protein
MSRKPGDNYSTKFSLSLSSAVAYCLRRHAHYNFLSLSDIMDEAVEEWLISHAVHDSREDIDTTYQMEK